MLNHLNKLEEMINSFPPTMFPLIKEAMLSTLEKAKKDFEIVKDYIIIEEHFGRADCSIEVVKLAQGNICVIHRDGEAIIFPCIYTMCQYQIHGKTERFYCDEKQLSFVYSNFIDYYDIKNNFDVEHTKRKQDGNNKS